MHLRLFLVLCAVPLIVGAPQQSPNRHGAAQALKRRPNSKRKCHLRTIKYLTSYEIADTVPATQDYANDATATATAITYESDKENEIVPYQSWIPEEYSGNNKAGADGYSIDLHPTTGLEDHYSEDYLDQIGTLSAPDIEGTYSNVPHHNNGDSGNSPDNIESEGGEDEDNNYPLYTSEGDETAIPPGSEYSYSNYLPYNTGGDGGHGVYPTNTLSFTDLHSSTQSISPTSTTSSPATSTMTTSATSGTAEVLDILSIRRAAVTKAGAAPSNLPSTALAKRQATAEPDGYVGPLTDTSADTNPSACNFAARVTFTGGQLIADGVTVSVDPGVSFINLRNARNGSIATNFSIQNGVLVWANPNFSGGFARFCQVGSEIPVALFTNADPPADCVLIDLLVFTSTACDNGELASGSSSATVSSTSAVTSGLTTVVSTATDLPTSVLSSIESGSSSDLSGTATTTTGTTIPTSSIFPTSTSLPTTSVSTSDTTLVSTQSTIIPTTLSSIVLSTSETTSSISSILVSTSVGPDTTGLSTSTTVIPSTSSIFTSTSEIISSIVSTTLIPTTSLSTFTSSSAVVSSVTSTLLIPTTSDFTFTSSTEIVSSITSTSVSISTGPSTTISSTIMDTIASTSISVFTTSSEMISIITSITISPSTSSSAFTSTSVIVSTETSTNLVPTTSSSVITTTSETTFSVTSTSVSTSVGPDTTFSSTSTFTSETTSSSVISSTTEIISSITTSLVTSLISSVISSTSSDTSSTSSDTSSTTSLILPTSTSVLSTSSSIIPISTTLSTIESISTSVLSTSTSIIPTSTSLSTIESISTSVLLTSTSIIPTSTSLSTISSIISSTSVAANPCSTNAPAYYIVDRSLVREDFVFSSSGVVTSATTTTIRSIVGDGTSTIDALGFNSRDGFLYAAMGASPSQLIRISTTDGSYTVLGSLGLTENAVAGVVDENSQYWLTDSTNTRWTQVNLFPGSSTFSQVVASGTMSGLSSPVSDWAFVPGTLGGNHLYGVAVVVSSPGVYTTNLLSFDRSSHSWTIAGTYSASGPANYQSVYAGVDSIFAADSTTGSVYTFPLPGSGGSALPIVTLAGGPTGGLADGARCAVVA